MTEVTEVKFNGRASLKVKYVGQTDWSRNTGYVKDIPTEVRELLANGVRINVKESASTVRPLLTELLGFPIPEDEPKTVIRYGLRIAGGRRMFESNDQAVAYWKRYNRGTPLSIKEVEVQA